MILGHDVVTVAKSLPEKVGSHVIPQDVRERWCGASTEGEPARSPLPHESGVNRPRDFLAMARSRIAA